MSSEAVGWVFRYSPLTGTAFAVHLAVADSVNDQHDYELWMRQTRLAVKARCSRGAANRALATMIEQGLIELVEEGRTKGAANRYRFLMPSLWAVFDPTGGVTREHTPLSPERAPGVTTARTGCVESAHITQGEPKTDPNNARELGWQIPNIVTESGHLDAAVELCDYMAAQLEARGYVGTIAKARSKRWVLDMEQLLRLDGRSAEQIRFVLDWLNRGDDEVSHFWRCNVRSPGKLREQLPVLREQWHRLESKPARNGNTYKPTDPEGVARVLAEHRNAAPDPPRQSVAALPSPTGPQRESSE